ncbi:golgin subfamily A member 6-like protein 22 [Papaver somniferum]|uniref:golgin subfamily A member 6-like protein 22 n=1 Tax=Papaver somniferum TaxID=3469 RepID=UPI000E6F80C4|nr:golgin subfamily A member 6-like protein 22 [Papaver somniferum]
MGTSMVIPNSVFSSWEEELNSAEAVVAAKDKEMLELKNRLKGKEQLGASEEKLRLELALVRSKLEKAHSESSSSKAGDVKELSWLRSERTRQASRIRELVEKIKDEADKWNGRADEHNELAAQYRERREQMVDMQNSWNANRRQFNGALLWTRENLREEREDISRLETKVANLEEELRQDRSSLYPDIRGYIQRLVRERDDAREEACAFSNALSTSRADVVRLIKSEKDLEDEYYFLDEARDAVVNEYEIDSSSVEELGGHLSLANEKLKEAQSSLVHQQDQTKYYEGLARSRDDAAKEAAKEVSRLKSSFSQYELKAGVIAYKAHCQLSEEVNNTLTKIEQSLLKDHGIVKKYPRRPMPEPVTYTSDRSSGGSVPSSQKKNPADHVESSKGK